MKMVYDVFICYSSKDKSIADTVCAALESKGIHCWIAPRDISPGADYGESIIDGINHVKVLVLIFSSNANASQSQIKREVERAVHKNIPIIPFRIEDIAPVKALEYFLSTPHWLDAFTPPLERHFNSLATAVRHQLDKETVEEASPSELQSAMHKLGGQPAHSMTPFLRRGAGWAIPSNWSRPALFGIGTLISIAVVALVAINAPTWWQRTDAPEDKRAWEIAAQTDTIPAYEAYLREEADGHHVDSARVRINDLREEIDRAWTDARRQNTVSAMQAFINKYGKDEIHSSDALAAIQQLQQLEAAPEEQTNTLGGPIPPSSDSAQPKSGSAPQSAPGVQSSESDLSLNCKSATYLDEKTICQNAGLATLERRMAQAYAALRDRQATGGLPPEVISYARAALSKRHECGNDVDCITSSLLAAKTYYEGYAAQK